MDNWDDLSRRRGLYGSLRMKGHVNAALAAIEFYLPERYLDNRELAELFPDWPAEKIAAKTGIHRRPIAGPDECSSDLAVRAAEKVFASGSTSREDIDFLVLCTQSPDYFLPTTACLIQHRLGLATSCGAMDVNLGCSGYIYGLGLAKALIENGQSRNVLLITADTYSKFIHPLDKSVRTLFGDAGAATVVTAVDARDAQIGPFVYGTDGSGGGNLIVPTGGLRRRFAEHASIEEDASGNMRTVNDLYMNGSEVFNFSLRVVPDTVARLLEKSGLRIEDIDLYVFHQANQYMLEHLRKRLKLPADKFLIAMEDVGNTVSCSIPIAMKKAFDSGRIQTGSLLMLVGFGVGYSWGATLVRWVSGA